jgi:hypothetical protein
MRPDAKQRLDEEIARAASTNSAGGSLKSARGERKMA